MTSTPEDPQAESLFAGFLARREAGEGVDFERFCAEHPDHAQALRSLWAHHLQVGGLIDDALPGGFSFFRAGCRESPDVPPGAVRAGDVIGDDFRLVELLAKGGMGEVWVAWQLSMERRVALKLVLPERVNSESLALFAREARAGGRLSHAEGVVTFYGRGTSEDQAWIAMELVEGSWTLRDFLDEMAAGEELHGDYYRRAAELGARVADALQAAHEVGVIHRDVKPRNILIGSDDRPRLTDFGLARLTDEEAISRTGDFAGTYAYMSPEQVAAKRAGIDHLTDVFSLGVVLYELLSLHQPFTGETTHQIAEKILTHDPPDLRRIRPSVPRDLAVICTKALEKARRDRYPSMAELAADLRRFMADEPIRARPPTVGQKLARWVRKHPTRSAVAATAGVAAILLYVSTSSPPTVPFSGPDYEHLLVPQFPGDKRSPTFVGSRYLLFERRLGDGEPGLALIDLTTSLTARPWSPPGEVCAAPAVAPDGQWLAYEVPAGEDDGETRTAIVIRRLDSSSMPLRWPLEDHERLEPANGSVRGVRWGPTSRFLYTHDLGETLVLKLHDVESGGGDVELLSLPDDYFPDIQASFSPAGERVVVAMQDGLETVRLDPTTHSLLEVRTQTLDCGGYRDPIWLEDDSILFARATFREASTRLYRRAGGKTSHMEDLESLLVGDFIDMAVSPDQSMLALVGRMESGSMFLCADGGPPTELPTGYAPSHPIWTPDGRLIYGADTMRVLRLYLHDPASGREEPLELDVPGLELPWDTLHLDQPAFSQNGRYLAFRASGEPTNDLCDLREWIVVTLWPPESGGVVGVPIEGRRINFPHVDDSGERLVWTEERADGVHVFTASLEGGRTDIVECMTGSGWPARISGDGQKIAVPIWKTYEPDAADPEGSGPRSEWAVALIAWDGTELGTIDDPGHSHRPEWLPGDRDAPTEGDRLAYFQGDTHTLHVRVVATDELEDPSTSFSLPWDQLSGVPAWADYDPWTERVVYNVDRIEEGDLWLARPAWRKEKP